jgi:apolipoprotein D and lipocalin family protein
VAYLRSGPDVGSLKVSFFRPFWGGYHIIALDKQGYQWALVTSSSRSYLWILARNPSLPQPLLNDLLARARRSGFETDKLIHVTQNPVPPDQKGSAP